MAWQGIVAHDRIVDQFRRALQRGRLASTFLLVGPPGVGKRTFALKMAEALLCETNSQQLFEPCGRCPSCVQVRAATHPDLEIVTRPRDKSFIPVEAFIGDREHRMREGLCHNIALKPYRGGRKVAIIADADDLNQEGANCLLKTLEEPPPNSVIVLIGTSEQRQLPTIRSRCQVIRFAPLADEVVAQLLLEQGVASKRQQAERLAQLGRGSLQRAIELSDSRFQEFRELILDYFSTPGRDSVDLAKQVAAFVDEAGKDASARRARFKQVIEIAVQYYRQLMRQLSGNDADGDATLVGAAQRASKWWPGDQETAADCVQRCLEAQLQVDRNANQSSLIDCWIDDLRRTELVPFG